MHVTLEMVSGKTEEHLSELNGDCLLHQAVVAPFQSLQAAAAEKGIDLEVASGFRSFERQLAIWNAKASGQRLVLDDQSQPFNLVNMSERERVFAMLRWSALPGCSRHHWGTDMDVWDAAAVSPDYVLQLTPDEYQQNGPFHKLSCWLGEHAGEYGFVWPYEHDNGGVAPEPWHLSYSPVAQQFEARLNAQCIRKILDNSELVLKDTILNCLDEIIPKFIFSACISK